MNKTPIFMIIALLVVIVIAFTGCEFEINLNGENNVETSIESIVVTDEVGSTSIETVVHEITTEPVPVVTIVEVTNEKGKVVETEKITLSPEEVQQGKDFFNGKDDKNETVKETEKDSGKKPGKNPEKETGKNPDKESGKTTDKDSGKVPNKEPSKAPNKEPGRAPNTEPGKDTGKDTTKETTEISKEPAPDRVTTAPSNENVEVQDDFKVLNSSKYLIEGRVVTADGVTYPYKMARDGNRFTFMSVYEGQEMCIIMAAKYVYIVSPETKTYAKLSKDLVADETGDTEEFEALLNGDAFNLYANKKQVETYNEKMYGIKYKVVVYDDGTEDYFNGKTLVQTVSEDGSILYYDVISPNVSEGMFIPPADYTEEVITSEMASELAESMSTTAYIDPDHKH